MSFMLCKRFGNAPISILRYITLVCFLGEDNAIFSKIGNIQIFASLVTWFDRWTKGCFQTCFSPIVRPAKQNPVTGPDLLSPPREILWPHGRTARNLWRKHFASQLLLPLRLYSAAWVKVRPGRVSFCIFFGRKSVARHRWLKHFKTY